MCRRFRTRSRGDSRTTPRSGSQMAGMDGPMIGAASAIVVDAISERESGATPPPPPVSVGALAIFFVGMFLVGLIGLILLMHFFGPDGAAF